MHDVLLPSWICQYPVLATEQQAVFRVWYRTWKIGHYNPAHPR